MKENKKEYQELQQRWAEWFGDPATTEWTHNGQVKRAVPVREVQKEPRHKLKRKTK